MYKSNVVIAVNMSLVGLVSPLVSSIEVEKYHGIIKEGKAYYELIGCQWMEENYAIANLINALDSIEHESFAFVRLGDDPQDTEIHGAIQNFDISVVRSVKY